MHTQPKCITCFNKLDNADSLNTEYINTFTMQTKPTYIIVHDYANRVDMFYM